MASGTAGIRDTPGEPNLPANLEQDLQRALAGDTAGRQRACKTLSQLYPDYAPEIRAALGLQPGTLAGTEAGFRILEPLGEGSLGQVYLAERRGEVAGFELHKFRLGKDRDRLLILREGKPGALESLGDPVLAADLGLESRPGCPRYLLEELQASPVTEFCDRRQLSAKRRITLILQACDGIQHAHQLGLSHLDLKPSNLVVDDRCRPWRLRVLHFGLAEQADANEASLSYLGGQYLGSPRYMSPEQAGRGRAQPDLRSDVFSLAAVLHELLVGFPPLFPDLLADLPVDEMRRRIRDQSAISASKALKAHPQLEVLARARGTTGRRLRRTLAGDLDAVLAKALARDPEHRYPSMDAFAADLRRFLGRRAVEARNENALESLARLASRHRRSLSGLALAGLGFGAGYALTIGDEAPQPTSSTPGSEQPEARGDAPENLQEANLRRQLKRSEARVLQLEVEDLVAGTRAADSPPLDTNLEEQRSALQAWLAIHAEPLETRSAQLDSLLQAAESASLGSQALRDGLIVARDSIRECMAEVIRKPQARLAWVEARLRWLEDEDRQTLDAYADRWQTSIRAIEASPVYQGLRLQPQAGLIPLGKDPASGLFEFFHPGSAAGDRSLPEPNSTGALQIGGDSGIVFVLIPAVTMTLGAQGGDPRAPNYSANYHESPDHVPTVNISIPAFFLGKYELTQGQWLTLSGEVAGFYPAGGELPSGERIELNHPVEDVSSQAAWRVVNWAGLRLPTEAEWEYAALGGAAWSSAQDLSALEGQANLSDRSVERLKPWAWPQHRELLRLPHLRSRWPSMDSFDDGYVVHAEVGTFRANGFGLHDMRGNVAEWCEGWLEAGADDPYIPRGDHFLSRKPAPLWRRDSLGRGTPGGQPHIGLRAARSILQ